MDMETSLWQRRLGRLNEKWFNYLVRKDILIRLNKENLEKCSHCMTGKETRVSFKSNYLSHKLDLLQMVHYDVKFVAL